MLVSVDYIQHDTSLVSKKLYGAHEIITGSYP